MGESSSKLRAAPGRVRDSRFWDGVEEEVEAPDVHDLAEFLTADALPFAPRPEFFAELREELRSLVKKRYST